MVNLADYYQPHAGQQKLHLSNADEKYEEAGRRFGKSRGAIGELLDNYIQWLKDYSEGTRMSFLVPHWHCWVVVPDYNQGRQAWNELKAFIPMEFRKTPPRNGVHEEEKTIELRGPDSVSYGLIELKSAHDPDTLQTTGLDFLWVSESQDISDRAVNEKLRPTLHSPGRYGKALFEGIPSMWPDHWFRRGCVAAQRDTTGRRAYFHFTAFENPLLSDKQKEDINWDKELMTDAAWRRMYLAVFNVNSGFFRGIDACIAGSMLSAPVPGQHYSAGLDFGVSNDATVLNIMDREQRKTVQRFRWDSTPWPDQKEAIVLIAREWKLEDIACDTSNMGGIVMFQDLEQAGLSVREFKFQGENRQIYLRTLQVAIEHVTYTFPQIDTLIRELRQFQYIRLQSGQYRVQAPSGEKDDEVMSAALGLQTVDAPIPYEPMPVLPVGGRYVPTQAEADGLARPAGRGARAMQSRHSDRLLERARDAGVLA